MTTLSVAILGLGRVGTSVGLALKQYMTKGGKYTFEIVGHDTFSANEKKALQLGAIDKIDSYADSACSKKDIVVMAMPYEDVKVTYKRIGSKLRDGVVILDMSPLKHPSFEWNDTYLTEEHHVIGTTPICNPAYLLDVTDTPEVASADYFENGAMLITPAVNSVKEAVDLAYNFSAIIGSKPRFLDPIEHDNLLAQTEQAPQLLGVALYYHLMRQTAWSDTQWFTNAQFGSLTRVLKDKHPDALRDSFMGNSHTLARTLDELISTLSEVRDLLRQQDQAGVEAFIVSSADNYSKWINRRHANDWDKDIKPPKVETQSFMSMIFGQKIASRLTGKKDDKS